MSESQNRIKIRHFVFCLTFVILTFSDISDISDISGATVITCRKYFLAQKGDFQSPFKRQKEKKKQITITTIIIIDVVFYFSTFILAIAQRLQQQKIPIFAASYKFQYLPLLLSFLVIFTYVFSKLLFKNQEFRISEGLKNYPFDITRTSIDSSFLE